MRPIFYSPMSTMVQYTRYLPFRQDPNTAAQQNLQARDQSQIQVDEERGRVADAQNKSAQADTDRQLAQRYYEQMTGLQQQLETLRSQRQALLDRSQQM